MSEPLATPPDAGLRADARAALRKAARRLGRLLVYLVMLLVIGGVRAVLLAPIAAAAVVINREGLVNLFEGLGQPLWKAGVWPLILLGQYVETRKVSVAHVLALAMILALSYVLELVLGYVKDDKPADVERMVVYTLTALLLPADCVLFWLGLRQGAFLGGASFVGATVLTVIYAAIVVLLAVVMVKFKSSVFGDDNQAEE